MSDWVSGAQRAESLFSSFIDRDGHAHIGHLSFSDILQVSPELRDLLASADACDHSWAVCRSCPVTTTLPRPRPSAC